MNRVDVDRRGVKGRMSSRIPLGRLNLTKAIWCLSASTGRYMAKFAEIWLNCARKDREKGFG